MKLSYVLVETINGMVSTVTGHATLEDAKPQVEEIAAQNCKGSFEEVWAELQRFEPYTEDEYGLILLSVQEYHGAQSTRVAPGVPEHRIRCEGYHRRGGAFTIGVPQWEQCKEMAIVQLVVNQEGKESTLPACEHCWKEARSRPVIQILEVKPLSV